MSNEWDDSEEKRFGCARTKHGSQDGRPEHCNCIQDESVIELILDQRIRHIGSFGVARPSNVVATLLRIFEGIYGTCKGEHWHDEL
jgi:hypothetical protein